MIHRILLAVVAALALAPAAHARVEGPPQLLLEPPADGALTSPFGHDGSRWHTGLDIGVLRSLEVTAATPGRVVRAGTPRGYEGYGVVVEIAWGGGWSTLYAHLAHPIVRVGDEVRTGDRIGIAGCTGWCTGTHLHFELRRGGLPLDPTPLLVPA